MNKLFFSVLVLLFAVISLNGQDVHLSQYYTSNVALNPALTGQSRGDLKATLNYRNQWSQIGGPIVTNFLAVEKKFHWFKDEIGIGLLFVDDRVEVMNYGTNKLLVSVAFNKEYLGHHIALGVQTGIVSHRSGLAGATFPRQWDYSQGEFDQGIASGENMTNAQGSYLDLNAGISWTKRMGNFKPLIGYGVFHVIQPNEAIVSGVRKLPLRGSGHAKIDILLREDIILSPNALYLSTAATEDLIVGLNFIKSFGPDIRFLLGGSMRDSDALIGILGVGYKQFDFGLSMDYNTSGLSESISQKSAFELSLIYTHKDKKFPQSFTVPCGVF